MDIQRIILCISQTQLQGFTSEGLEKKGALKNEKNAFRKVFQIPPQYFLHYIIFIDNANLSAKWIWLFFLPANFSQHLKGPVTPLLFTSMLFSDLKNIPMKKYISLTFSKKYAKILSKPMKLDKLKKKWKTFNFFYRSYDFLRIIKIQNFMNQCNVHSI